jgi:hypothetical protein
MADRKVSLQLVFDENLKRDTNLPTTERLAFDDLGDFIEERERIKRALERRNNTELKVDYSDFANHVFFDFAEEKLGIAVDRVLGQYPFNGSGEEKDAFELTGSGYENYLFEQWPREVAYAEFDGTSQFISGTDTDNKLFLGSSSLYVSAWANPAVTGENVVLSKIYKNNNLFPYSERYDNASFWSVQNIAISSSATTGPFSGTVADVLSEDGTAAALHRLNEVGSVGLGPPNPSGSYTISAYVKPINRTWCRIFFNGDVGTNSAYFNLVGDGTVGTEVGDVAGKSFVERVSDDWYRVSCNYISSGSVINFSFMVSEDDNVSTFDGLSQDSFAVWGLHCQEDVCDGLSYTYVPSSGSEVQIKNGYELIFSGAVDPHVKFSLYSGSSVASVSASYSPYLSAFNNVAAIYDANASEAWLYINDVFQTGSVASFGSIDFPAGRVSVASGSKCVNPFLSGAYDFYTGSLDEVRVAHTASSLWHQKNYSRPIDAEDYLKLHYKFNEGITGTGSVDNFVVDYSKSGLHGRYYDYVVDSSRVSGSIMLSDPGDPILYSFDDRVVAFTGTLALSASLYDLNNNNNIFNLIPEGVLLEDDLANGLLRSFSLAMARFFDDIKLYIDQFVNLRVSNYDGIDETPDIFLPFLKRYFGWKVSEHFDDAVPGSFLFGENVLASGSLETSLLEIRNQFWRRTLNNFPLLMKSKGTRKNVDYLLNVFGLTSDNIRVKEYGYLPGTSIQDERIAKQRVQHRLGIGTGSVGTLSSSFVTVGSGSLFSGSDVTNEYSIELMAQLPFASSSYSGSILSGGLWQLDSTDSPESPALTSSIRCFWVRDSFLSETGKIILEASSSVNALERLSSSNLSLFDGGFIHVAAGYDPSQVPFLSIRKLDGPVFALSEDFTGSAFSVAPSPNQSLFVGANTSSLVFDDRYDALGYFGEVRFWDRKLSGSEIDDHALNFQSVGTNDPFDEVDDVLRGHWALNEDITATAAGEVENIVDLSRNGRTATGKQFVASQSPYEKFLHDFNYLSPSVDLKWTENKIRIRNQTELDFFEQAVDTNEVSLEFNLVESLNEDIVKIFSTLESFNNLIGQPVFKYRDEYSDLEGMRREYFRRLSDQLNFTQFFNLFKWFDKKVSDAVKQVLPTRARFIGGEQVVESHLLERPKYKFQYPLFRTPQEVPEIEVDASAHMSGSDKMRYVEASEPFYGTSTSTSRDDALKLQAQNTSSVDVGVRPSTVALSGDGPKTMRVSYADGAERVDRGGHGFVRRKVSGDTTEDIESPDSAMNFKNAFAKRGWHKHQPQFYDASLDQEHYFGGARKALKVYIEGRSPAYSGDPQFTIAAGSSLELSQSLYTTSDIALSGSSIRLLRVVSRHPTYDANVSVKVSASGEFASADFDILFKDSLTPDWLNYSTISGSWVVSTKPDSLGYYDVSRGFYFFDLPEITIDPDNIHFLVQNKGAIDYTFKNLRLNYVEYLSDDAVKDLKEIDNQTLEFEAQKVDTLKNVE